MTKSEFLRKFLALPAEKRAEVREYYEDLWKGAVLAETLAEAEKRLLWIREVRE